MRLKGLCNPPSFVFGRFETCDIVAEHPSLSRFHAVIQHSRDGLSPRRIVVVSHPAGKVYVYDLGSTHGTKINKTPVEPRTYTELPFGQLVRFGQR